VFDYIEGWRNVNRLHSSLGYDTPIRHERRYAARIAQQEKEVLARPEGSSAPSDEDAEVTIGGTSQMSSAALSAEPG